MAGKVYTLRARKAALARSRGVHDPELLDVSRTLRAEVLKGHIAKTVAAAPPLTPAQLDELARLLLPPGWTLSQPDAVSAYASPSALAEAA